MAYFSFFVGCSRGYERSRSCFERWVAREDNLFAEKCDAGCQPFNTRSAGVGRIMRE
jgi:hypothetical protein